MKTKDLITITTAALGTAALTVAAFLGTQLDAGNEASPPAPTIPRPQLVVNGIKLTVTAAGDRQLQAGDEPAFELEAANTLSKPSTASVCLLMSAAAPSSPLSRVLVIPTRIWCETRSLALGPNETRTFTFTANTNLPANCIITVSMSERDPLNTSPLTAGTPAAQTSGPILEKSIVGLSISTIPPGVASASVLARLPAP